MSHQENNVLPFPKVRIHCASQKGMKSTENRTQAKVFTNILLGTSSDTREEIVGNHSITPQVIVAQQLINDLDDELLGVLEDAANDLNEQLSLNSSSLLPSRKTIEVRSAVKSTVDTIAFSRLTASAKYY